MNDDLFIPRHLARLLLDELVSWEIVESIGTLLTIAYLREPLEIGDSFSTYAFKAKEVKDRVRLSIPWDKYHFFYRGQEIPFIYNFKVHSKGYYSYQVHHLANPTHYHQRHRFLHPFSEYPVDLWKLPRHIWIRWRYASRLPIHKSLFAKPEPIKEFEINKKAVLKLSDAISSFKASHNTFKNMMCACDVSTIGFSFLCFTYFFAHDSLISCLRNQLHKPSTFLFLRNLESCFSKACYLDLSPSYKILKCESWVRAALPVGFFNKAPFSIFSNQSFTKSI